MANDKFLFVVSGAAGTGKDSVVKALREAHPEIEKTVSATTRAPRPGEQEGVDYYYRTREQFQQLLESDQVIEEHRDLFEVELLTANNNVEMLANQVEKFSPNCAIICNSERYSALVERLGNCDTKLFAGIDSVKDYLASADNIDIVVAAMVGFSGQR